MSAAQAQPATGSGTLDGRPLVEKQIADQARTHNIPEDEVLEKIMLANSPIKRLVEPAEVASLATWLASDSAGMVTGASYTMDGAWTAGWPTHLHPSVPDTHPTERTRG